MGWIMDDVTDLDWVEFYIFFNSIQYNLIGLDLSFLFCQSNSIWIELIIGLNH